VDGKTAKGIRLAGKCCPSEKKMFQQNGTHAARRWPASRGKRARPPNQGPASRGGL